MANIKIVADNAADRATLTADSTAGTLVATNVQADGKGAVHRATGKSVSYSLAFATPEQVACAAVLGNFSPTTTMRVRVTNEPQATNLFLFSDQFDNAVWAKGATTTISIAGLTASPDGTMNARTFWGTAAGTNTFSQAVTLTQGQPYSASAFFKIGTYTGSVTVADTTEAGMMTYNLQTAVATVSGIFTTPVVKSYGNGWYRVSWTVTPTAATSPHTFAFSSAGGTSYAYVWGAMLAAGSLSSYYPTAGAAATRPLGYIDAWQAYALDSGAIAACSAPAPKLRGFTAQQAASAYAFGGGAYATVWFNSMSATGVRIDIADPNNPQGYVEAWRVIAGDAWSPKYNPDWGAGVTPTDNSKIARLESGDSVTSQGTRGRKLSLPLKGMPATDRSALFDILRANGTGWPMLVSLFPGDADKALERDHMLWAKLSTLSAMVVQAWGQFNSSLEFEEA